MDKFETFFRELYSDTHKTLDKVQKDGYVELADSLTVFGTEGDKTQTRGGIFVPVHYLSF